VIWHFFTSALAFFVHLDLATLVCTRLCSLHAYSTWPCID